MYSLGSYDRGDWVMGLSDLDLYLIIKDSAYVNGKLRPELKKRLDSINEKIREDFPLVEFRCKYESESKVREHIVESFITGQDSRFLYGRNILEEIPSPSLKDLKEYGRKMVVLLCNHWIKTEEQRRTPQNLKDQSDGMQYMILKLAQNGLFAKGILKFKKKDIVKTFLETYPDFTYNELIEEAFEVRRYWNTEKIDESRLRRFVNNSKIFPEPFRDYITAQ